MPYRPNDREGLCSMNQGNFVECFVFAHVLQRLRNKGETEKRMDKPKKRSKTED